MGVVDLGASSHPYPQFYTEPVVNLKGKESQLDKVQVRVFNYASQTLCKDHKWTYKSEESHDRCQSSLNEVIASCLLKSRGKRQEHIVRGPQAGYGPATHAPLKSHVRHCPGNRTCWLNQQLKRPSERQEMSGIRKMTAEKLQSS